MAGGGKVVSLNSLYLKNIAIGVFLSLVLVRFSFIHHQVLGDMFVLTIIWFFIGVLFNLKNLESMKLLDVKRVRK